MTATTGDDALTQVLRKTILAMVRRDDVDLTNRQLGVFLTVYLILLCHNALASVCCFCRQQGQRGSARTRPTARQRRMLAMECGTCRSGRTGAARPEALG